MKITVTFGTDQRLEISLMPEADGEEELLQAIDKAFMSVHGAVYKTSEGLHFTLKNGRET